MLQIAQCQHPDFVTWNGPIKEIGYSPAELQENHESLKILPTKETVPLIIDNISRPAYFDDKPSPSRLT
jgi:hypothetical protein